MKLKTFPIVLITLMLLLSACGPANSTPTPTQGVTVNLDVSGVADYFSLNDVHTVSSGTPGPWIDVMPDYTQVDLQGYPVGKASSSPQIFVYPVKDLKVNAAAAKAVQDLQALLQSQQPGKVMPYLPVQREVQMLHPQVKFMDFKNGKGVRYLTEWSSGLVPVNNRNLLYTFQGLTADGRYYVAAQLPANLASLPADEMSLDNLPPEFSSDYTKYLSDTAARIDQQAAEAFTPDLGKLDAMIQSIEVK
jgi:hypothetical protein